MYIELIFIIYETLLTLTNCNYLQKIQLNNCIKNIKLLQYFSIFIYIFKEDSLFYISKKHNISRDFNIFIRALINIYIFSVYLI